MYKITSKDRDPDGNLIEAHTALEEDLMSAMDRAKALLECHPYIEIIEL